MHGITRTPPLSNRIHQLSVPDNPPLSTTLPVESERRLESRHVLKGRYNLVWNLGDGARR
jgi:hypothetical protein